MNLTLDKFEGVYYRVRKRVVFKSREIHLQHLISLDGINSFSFVVMVKTKAEVLEIKLHNRLLFIVDEKTQKLILLTKKFKLHTKVVP